MLQYSIPSPLRGGSKTKDFRAAAPTVEQAFLKPLNAGRKPVQQQRIQPRSELSTDFDCIIAVPTTSPTSEAPAGQSVSS